MGLLKFTSVGGPDVRRGMMFHIAMDAIYEILPGHPDDGGSKVWTRGNRLYFAKETPEEIAQMMIDVEA